MSQPDLNQQLAAAQQKLAADQAALEKALAQQDSLNAQLASINGQLNTLHTQIDQDTAAIAAIEAQLSSSRPKTVLGGWPQIGPAPTKFADLEKQIGTSIFGYRSTGGEGQLDDTLLETTTLAMAKQSHLVSLQFQPKTGKGSPRQGVPYKDITAGKHDTFIFAEMKKFLTLPTPPRGLRYPFECHSEFDVQKPNSAQPVVGPAADYAPFVMHLDKLARQAGVRQLLDFICGSGAYRFWTHDWQTWITPALRTSGAIDTLGVDFYAKDKNGYVTPQQGTGPIIAVAKQVKLPYAVLETGCDEMPGKPGGKAAWIDSWQTVLKTDPPKFLFFNTNLGGYDLTSSTQALAAFKRLATSALIYS